MKTRLDANGWQMLTDQWSLQCETYGEDFAEYASASLTVLRELAIGPRQRNAAVFGFGEAGDDIRAVCQVNSAHLPSYTGKVLRVRHIVFAPVFDLSDQFVLDDYADVLISVFLGALEIADNELKSEHVKFHLRSPAEREFGAKFTQALGGNSAFSKVDMRGTWIYLSRS